MIITAILSINRSIVWYDENSTWESVEVALGMALEPQSLTVTR